MKKTEYSKNDYDENCVGKNKNGMKHDEFVYFMNLFGNVLIIESQDMRKKNQHPFEYLYDNLWSKPWYHDINVDESHLISVISQKRNEKK